MKGKTLHSGERNLVLKVLEFFENEKRNKQFCLPVDQAVKRTCMATGISKATLMRIKNEAKRLQNTSPTPGTSASSTVVSEVKLSTPSKKRKPKYNRIQLDSFDIGALRNIVNSFYTVRKEIPTLNKILSVAKRDLNFQGQKTYLRKVLVDKLGYKFKKCKDKRHFLSQKPDIRAWRARWIVVHGGGENGFVNGAELIYKCKSNSGDYHHEMNTANFKKWILEKLIPNLPLNSIVVLDNAPYHSTQIEKPPTGVATNGAIRQWLLNHNITFDERMTKSEMYHLLHINKLPKKYLIDELFKEHGHEVVRLPPYMCDLNPIEYVWNLVKQRVANKNINQAEREIEKLTRDAITSISESDWKKEVNHVDRLRQKYWDDDLLLLQETNESQLIVNLSDTSSSSDYSETEDEEQQM
ncbi:hypothetical protein HF086_017611 [Spodoptera exigua]|uniref:Tc1-like transposase DDE domain-containing protein n=1 Tax=Spodoptera exigua TaxID=7107 RepID=A0A922MP32_SPOEX|nr:hypothetical protein HF086_017611 [Spodoptera exigua]